MEDLQIPAVKYEALIHCVNSRRDIYGNVYWLAYFENPADADKQAVCVEVASPGNARMLASKALYGEKKTKHGTFANGNARCYVTEEEIGKRLWFRRRKGSLYEGAEETLEALRKLLAPKVG